MAKKKRKRIASENVPAGRVTAHSDEASRHDLWILLALALATLVVYLQVLSHQFISLDDDIYISENPIVARGLTLSGIAWAFTTFHTGNWHPLTWLSHMLDCQVFGLNAGGHHFINVLLHVANTLLLFWFLRRVTGSHRRSAMVAALFALHPLHVESVAWAAERKDMLSALFGLLSLLAYTRFVETRSRKHFGFVALYLALGLMAKPMLVTWPFVFLLLDYWPLRRIDWEPETGWKQFAKSWLPLLREKLPLFGLVFLSMIVTYIAQSHGGTVRALEDVPLSVRLANVIVSYAKYLVATFWPTGLGVYYPFPPGGIPAWQVIGALVLLAAVTVVAVREAEPRRYFIVGWLWFLGTLVPVIGLVQVGGQMMADRYHYLPSIGLFLLIVFGLVELAAAWRIARGYLAATAAIVLFVFASLSAIQIYRWRDSVALFEHTIAVTTDNLLVQYNLGHYLGRQRRFDEARAHFVEALRIKPDFFDALMNMGITASEQGQPVEAIGYFERALRVQPASTKAHAELALAFAKQGKPTEALAEFRRALELAPQDAGIRANLGLMLARQGDVTGATEQLNEAIRINPDSAEAHNNLGLVLLASGKAAESIPHFSAAVRLKPDLTVAQENLRRAQAQLDRGR